jgi:hypothetical protein
MQSSNREERMRAQNIGLALLAVATAMSAQQTRAGMQPPDLKRAEVTLGFFKALNRSDAEAAADVFSDNAFYSGASPKGLCSSSEPCYGRTNIRQAIDTLLKIPHLCETVTSIQISGSIVTGRIEIRGDSFAPLVSSALLQHS